MTIDSELNRIDFELFVERELGDVAVSDQGRYISPKIQNYWLTWQAAQVRPGYKTLPIVPSDRTLAAIDETIEMECGSPWVAKLVYDAVLAGGVAT